MKSYMVEFKTPYDTETGKGYVPEELYVSFLECMKAHKCEIISSQLIENAAKTENIPVYDAESFGWIIEYSPVPASEKDILKFFVPDLYFKDVMHRLKKPGSPIKLIDWSNYKTFQLEYPVLYE